MFEVAVSLNQMMMGLSSAIMHYNVDVGDAHVIVIVYYDIGVTNELILHTLARATDSGPGRTYDPQNPALFINNSIQKNLILIGNKNLATVETI